MMSQCSIPTHLTVLYMFAALSLTILFNPTVVEADVIAVDLNNQTLWKAADSQALFGAPIPEQGIWGHLIYQRTNCCEVKNVEPPPKHNATFKYIAMIKRGPCQFETKVYNAQVRGYHAVIIHNVGSDELERMGPGTKNLRVNISSVFIGAHDAQKFEKYDRSDKYLLWINNDSTFSYWPLLKDFVIIACGAFAFGLIIGLAVLVARWVRDVRHRRRSRLSLAHLKKIPVKRFKKGDQYDVCAICLDEYEDGDKLRILPCSHGYHQKCIDPWLTKNKKFCPICKRKVIPGEDDSESEEDSDEDGGQNENTPLLTQAANNTTTSTTRGGTFDHSGLPSALRDNVQQLCYDDTSSEDSFTASTSNYHSSVEVHQPIPRHVTAITMDDSSNTESADSDGDDVTDHVISNNTNANPLISIVSDHFGAANHVGSINGDQDSGSRSSLDEYRPLMEEAVAVNAPAVAVQPNDRQSERDQII